MPVWCNDVRVSSMYIHRHRTLMSWALRYAAFDVQHDDHKSGRIRCAESSHQIRTPHVDGGNRIIMTAHRVNICVGVIKCRVTAPNTSYTLECIRDITQLIATRCARDQVEFPGISKVIIWNAHLQLGNGEDNAQRFTSAKMNDWLIFGWFRCKMSWILWSNMLIQYHLFKTTKIRIHLFDFCITILQ